MTADGEKPTVATLVEPRRETPRAAPTQAPRADDEERRAFRRAMLIGLFVWPAFHGVDQYLGRVVYPGAPLVQCFILRVAGEAAIAAMYFFSYRKDVASLSLKLANVLVCGIAAVLISVMAVSFGGLTSPYLHGIAIVILVLALAVPGPWHDTILYVGACSLSFPIVMVVAARTHPDLALRLADGRERALFLAHYLILFGSAIVATVSSQASWNARQELRRARRLGRYRLEARIGEGGMNEVWMAWDQSLRRNVALKVLRSAGTDPRVVARFEREALALSRLTSPCTVRIFDFAARNDGFSFIAMELLDGRDVQALVGAVGPLEPRRAARLAREACISLAEAHAAGIVHRDVKPANLFVTTDGEEHLKVLDFGIARVLGDDSATRTQDLRGTPAYMAPETWTGAPVDARSDIYALGATLWFMLVGRGPFEEVATGDLVQAHLSQEPRRPGELVEAVPTELDAIVLRCLAKSPRDRYADARELGAALAACLEAR